MEDFKTIEYTIQIITKTGTVDYLMMELEENEELTDDMVLSYFDLYKNDESGQALKNEELENYTIIRKD